MSTSQLLQIVRDRGLSIVIVDGRPVLKRPHGNEYVTDKLLACLKRHRDRIIELVTRET